MDVLEINQFTLNWHKKPRVSFPWGKSTDIEATLAYFNDEILTLSEDEAEDRLDELKTYQARRLFGIVLEALLEEIDLGREPLHIKIPQLEDPERPIPYFPTEIEMWFNGNSAQNQEAWNAIKLLFQSNGIEEEALEKLDTLYNRARLRPIDEIANYLNVGISKIYENKKPIREICLYLYDNPTATNEEIEKEIKAKKFHGLNINNLTSNILSLKNNRTSSEKIIGYFAEANEASYATAHPDDEIGRIVQAIGLKQLSKSLKEQKEPHSISCTGLAKNIAIKRYLPKLDGGTYKTAIMPSTIPALDRYLEDNYGYEDMCAAIFRHTTAKFLYRKNTPTIQHECPIIEFKTKFREIRTYLGLSQEALGKEIRKTNVTMCHIENTDPKKKSMLPVPKDMITIWGLIEDKKKQLRHQFGDNYDTALTPERMADFQNLYEKARRKFDRQKEKATSVVQPKEFAALREVAYCVISRQRPEKITQRKTTADEKELDTPVLAGGGGV